jgi:Spx/MgsR family transcriptional regulator
MRPAVARPKLFHYPNCSTCKKAIKWLDAHGVEVEKIDIVERPPSKAQLKKVKELADLELRKLFNTSGQLYRGGGYKDKLPTMSEDEALSELAAHGKLIKRPILLGSDVALVGFKEADWKTRLG